MDEREKAALEAAGFRVGTVKEFLGLSEEESQLVELRAAVSRAIRARRDASHISQKEIARRMGTSQPRVTKIERGDEDVSLDAMFRELFYLGGRAGDVLVNAEAAPGD